MIKNSYQKWAKDLKKLGLISYDLRHNLTSGQKSQITKLRQEFGHAIKYPEKFHIATVGKATAKALKDSGYKVTKNNKAIVPLKEYSAAKISKGSITFSAGRLSEKVILSGAKDFHRKLKALTTKKLGKHQMISVKIGDNAPFNSRFGTYADMYKYVTEIFVPKDPGESKQKLLAKMSVVTITDPRTQTQRTKDRNAKAKKAPK